MVDAITNSGKLFRMHPAISRRTWTMIKTLMLALCGFVVAVEILHSFLNQTFHPFTGPVDFGMHLVLPLAPILYIGALS